MIRGKRRTGFFRTPHRIRKFLRQFRQGFGLRIAMTQKGTGQERSCPVPFWIQPFFLCGLCGLRLPAAGERAGIRVIHPVFHNFPQFSTVNCGEVGQLLHFLRYFVNSYPREGWKNHAGFQQIWWKPAWSVDFSTVFCAGCLRAGRVQSW